MILFPAIFARDDRHLRQEEHAAPDLLPPRARPLPLPEGRHPASDSRSLRKSYFHSGPIDISRDRLLFENKEFFKLLLISLSESAHSTLDNIVSEKLE